MIPTSRARLIIGDVVMLDDDFGNHWEGGCITAIRPDGFYVRWPDSVIGIFPHRHAHRLERVA